VQKSFDNLFINCTDSNSVWRYFAEAAGIQGPFVQLKQVIEVWWKAECAVKLKSLFKVTPAFIIWHIWKRRNLIKHGSNMTIRAMILGITRQLIWFVKTKFPWMSGVPNTAKNG